MQLYCLTKILLLNILLFNSCQARWLRIGDSWNKRLRAERMLKSQNSIIIPAIAIVMKDSRLTNKNEHASVNLLSSKDSIIDGIIRNLKTEVHIPGYHFCGPGTQSERFEKSEKAINLLDEACRRHDIAYTESNGKGDIEKADRKLLKAAQERMDAKDADKLEKLAAWIVVEAMKVKIAGVIDDVIPAIGRLTKYFSVFKESGRDSKRSKQLKGYSKDSRSSYGNKNGKHINVYRNGALHHY